MVVVEHASDRIGKTIEIEFIRSLQTAAGKMMFARPTDKQASHGSDNREQSPVSKPRSTNINKDKARGRSKAASNANRGSVSKSSLQSRKPRTSAQNESDLIKLVNEQK
ncbi:MAG TPA: hypothetical protein PKC86_02545 [Candidatus Saccharibacteria bacterium]|nr:hypothetical protein [Candidatus Saccharibacteria bacterium]